MKERRRGRVSIISNRLSIHECMCESGTGERDQIERLNQTDGVEVDEEVRSTRHITARRGRGGGRTAAGRRDGPCARMGRPSRRRVEEEKGGGGRPTESYTRGPCCGAAGCIVRFAPQPRPGFFDVFVRAPREAREERVGKRWGENGGRGGAGDWAWRGCLGFDDRSRPCLLHLVYPRLPNHSIIPS